MRGLGFKAIEQFHSAGGKNIILVNLLTKSYGRPARSINDFNFMFEGTTIEVTMTLGVSIFDKIMSIDECIKQADDALYKGKKSGKNCVVVN